MRAEAEQFWSAPVVTCERCSRKVVTTVVMCMSMCRCNLVRIVKEGRAGAFGLDFQRPRLRWLGSTSAMAEEAHWDSPKPMVVALTGRVLGADTDTVYHVEVALTSTYVNSNAPAALLVANRGSLPSPASVAGRPQGKVQEEEMSHVWEQLIARRGTGPQKQDAGDPVFGRSTAGQSAAAMGTATHQTRA